MPDCPLELDAVIYKLLAKNPEDRPFNARQVQAVMLQLDASSKAEASKSNEEEVVHRAGDVPAAEVVARGRELLKDEIDQQYGVFSRAEISWQKLVVMFAAIALLIVIATLLGR